MKLKINRYEFEVTNKDIILDNGSCYQCLTLKHPQRNTQSYTWIKHDIPTMMSKKQFEELLKNNQVVLLSEEKFPKLYSRYKGCMLWRFNVE